MSTEVKKIRVRRGAAASRPALSTAELWLDTDLRFLWIGDGVSNFPIVVRPGKVRYVSPDFAGFAAPYYSTVGAAVGAASAGDVIEIAEGTYAENVALAVNHLKILGHAAAPYFDGGTWGIGVRIQGTFSLGTTKGHVIKGIAFDGNGANADAFTSGQSTQINNTTITDCVFANIGSNSHLCLLQSGSDWMLHNLSFHDCGSGGHGLAIRASNVNASLLHFEDMNGGSTIIVKSDTGSGDARNVNISNVKMLTNNLNGGAKIVIESANAGFVTENINISNVTAMHRTSGTNCQYGLQVKQTAGTCRRVTVNNFVVDKTFGDQFLFTSGSDILLTNCRGTNSGGYTFNNAGATGVRIVDGGSSGATSGDATGTFDYLQINGLTSYGRLSKSVAGAVDVTLSASEYNNQILEFTGALTGNINVIVPLRNGTQWTVYNNTSGAFTLTVKGSSGTGIAITQGQRAIVYTNGTNVVRATADV